MSTRINRVYNLIYKSLFRIDGELDYNRVVDAFILLAKLVAECESDDFLWSIGECNEAPLDAILVGGYWFFTDYHSGQWSQEYKALSMIGQIYTPGYSSLEDDSPEKAVYEQLESLLKKRDLA